MWLSDGAPGVGPSAAIGVTETAVIHHQVRSALPLSTKEKTGARVRRVSCAAAPGAAGWALCPLSGPPPA